MKIPVDEIKVGERDRADLGDLDELAASIQAVGLLHPVVITESRELVAGERRLAAVRQLGWTEVPVTVVDLSTAADALRAEADENTCRKPLTPYEASRARERRARILAPAAKERQDQGRKRAHASRRGEPVGSSNLAEPNPPTARETRKVAAVGTGYSGSTLDKVDKIRDVAERGVVKRGKTEVPVPEPVREKAREALEEVKVTGAAVEAASRKVEEALAEYIEESVDVRAERLRKGVYRLVVQITDGLPKLDAAYVAQICDDDMWEAIANARHRLEQWMTDVSGRRTTGLRVVRGGR